MTVKLLSWVIRVNKALDRITAKPARITCIHAKGRFSRSVMAANAFTSHVKNHGRCVIAIPPAAIVDVLTALHLDPEENIKWWRVKSKFRYANDLIASKFSNVTIVPDTILEVEADLMWLEGTEASKLSNDYATIIYSGALNEDPFENERRMSQVKAGDKYYSEIVLPGERCSDIVLEEEDA